MLGFWWLPDCSGAVTLTRLCDCHHIVSFDLFISLGRDRAGVSGLGHATKNKVHSVDQAPHREAVR